jgi:hypothetical protein
MPFGLITAGTLDSKKSNSIRREVFYENLTGGFPLLGLLSLLDVKETCDKQEFGWREKRDIQLRSLTGSADATNGPFTTTSGASGAVGVNKTVAGWSDSAGTTVRVKVDDASVYRERDNVWIKDVPGTASSLKQFYGIVTAVWTTPNTIDVLLQKDIANALNGATTQDLWVTVIGSSATEAAYSKKGGVTYPIDILNYTQIFRTPIGPFSRDAIKMGVTWSKEGIYQDACFEAHVRHMKTMEWPLFFGQRSQQNETDSTDSDTKRVRTLGGIHWFLQQWDLGNTGNGGEFDYRPGGSDLTAVGWEADEDKRIIALAGATITDAQWNTIMERAFKYTGDQTFEKLVVCGNGFLFKLNRYLKKLGVVMQAVNEKETTFGMEMFVLRTVGGSLYFKTHPLFTRHPLHNNSAFILDLGSMDYHPYKDSDSMLLENRQPNDYDGRKDEWLTEYSFEMGYPERCLFIDNLGGILP